MNWFQKLWSNPNFHLVGAILSGAASVAFPAYAPALQVVAGTLGAVGVALPEQPGQAVIPSAPAAPVAPVVALPPAAAGGSYHAVDYANLAAALVAQFAATQPAPSRG